MDQTRLVTLDNGYHLFTRRVNEGTIKLLCLHGGPGGTHETFDNFKRGLENQEVEVYSYDQLGSYYSDQPDFTKKENQKYLSISYYVDEVEEVRKKLELDNFYLLEHSWGGLLAQEYAYKYGQHLKGLVLMSMIDNLDEYTENINREREETFNDVQVEYMKKCEDSENFSDPMYQKLVAELYSKFLTRYPTGTQHPVNTHNNVIYNYFQGNNEFVMVGELTKWDFRDKLAKLEMPTLSSFGEFDTMPLDAARRMQRTLKNARLSLTPDGGHCHNTDNPKAFFTSLVQFLKDVENNKFLGE